MSIWTILFSRRSGNVQPTPPSAQDTCEDRIVRFVSEMASKLCLQPDELHYRAWLDGAWARGLDVVLLPGVSDSFIINMDRLVARVRALDAGPVPESAVCFGGVAVEFQVDAA